MAVRRSMVCLNNFANNMFQLFRPNFTKTISGKENLYSLTDSVLASLCGDSKAFERVPFSKLDYPKRWSVCQSHIVSPNIKYSNDLHVMSNTGKHQNFTSMLFPLFMRFMCSSSSHQQNALIVARNFSTLTPRRDKTVVLQRSVTGTSINSWRRKHSMPKVPPTRIMSIYDMERSITDEEAAKLFVYALKPSERKYLFHELARFHGEQAVETTTTEEPPTRAQLNLVALHQMFPFIGFGFLDNFLMIVAGEYIDVTFGTALGISTMAAAALGNWFSDVCGLGLAHYVERFVAKFGIRLPHLSPTQVDMKSTKWASNLGKVIGVTIGCFLGMIPLLFFSDDKSKDKEDCSEGSA